MQARLKVFYEEELDVPLVLFNEVLDHVLRIDRIFKQNQVGVALSVSCRVCSKCIHPLRLRLRISLDSCILKCNVIIIINAMLMCIKYI